MNATLYGYGRLDWAALSEAVRDAESAWADYDGFHIGRCPSSAPPYTHLWAWAADWRLRARVDGLGAIVAVLSWGRSVPLTMAPCGVWTVDATVRLATTWGPDEGRVGRQREIPAARTVELHQIDGERPVTFVALRPQ